MNIKNLILQGEGHQLDFKNKISNEAKIAKTLVAFANHKGGKLLVGVADNGFIKGVKDEEEERFTLTRAAHLFCKPAIELSFEETFIDDKLVLITEIAESDTKPHYALDDQGKWWVYIRVKDKSILAGKVVIDVLRRSASEDGVFIAYSEKEKSLLAYLAAHQRAEQLDISKHIKLSRRKTQTLLTNLILAGLVKVHLDHQGEFYTAGI